MERVFDTYVENLKYRVLREVAKQAFEGTLEENLADIPKIIHPSKVPTMRCCVYKERAILKKRVKLAMGGNKNNPNIIEVIDIACDECPAAGYEVTASCRGCLAHRCQSVCRVGAISFDYAHAAHIDKTKCVECGKCASVCPFNAIANRKRPCIVACKIGAISINEENVASIDNEKCIQCGACIYQCPFGAIMDKSFILDVIDLIKAETKPLYAIVAPSIFNQFTYGKLGQVVSGLKKLGFTHVTEAALGADMVADTEARELAEKGFLTSSCCPAFVTYIEKNFPQLIPYVSHNLSPMATVAKYIKSKEPNAKTVFIGPCTAKKAERQKEEVGPYIDAVLTFEELQAMFDSRNIEISELEEEKLVDASYFGRIFARSGGVTEAIKQGLKEQGSDLALDPCVCNGISECTAALMRKSKSALSANFIEGMACEGGCMGGAGSLSHGNKNLAEVNRYGKEGKPTISGSLSDLNKKE